MYILAYCSAWIERIIHFFTSAFGNIELVMYINALGVPASRSVIILNYASKTRVLDAVYRLIILGNDLIDKYER